MSIAAARSPSPGPPARPCCAGLRRSTDSSPFKPAASPPDSPQQQQQRSSSVCKGRAASPRTWFAEKENDAREASARTHKVRSSGGKSFMAPTISAASKAVAPSSATPRKKILGERNNDPAPSSPVDLAHSSSKPRGPHPPPEPDECLGAPRRLRFSLDGVSAPPPPPPPAAGPVVSRGVQLFGGDEAAAVVVENPVSSNDHHVAADADADADAEAVAAPYDPKTNYLSPRPRFLRYQPNRHLQICRHGGGASVRGLEDSFASESSSEEVDTATTTTEEEVSGEEQPDPSTEEETSALALPSEPALDSPLARALTPEGKESSPRDGGVLIPQQEPAVSPARGHPKKKRSSMRFLFAPLALVLLMAAAFVCVPPPPGHPVMLNTSLLKVSEYLSVQELHPVELAARLKQWSSSSLDFVTSYWAEAIASYQGRDVFGPHLPANLSAADASDVDADYAVAFYYSTAQTSPISLEFGIQEVISESDTDMVARLDVEEEVNADAVVEEWSAEMAEQDAEMAEEVPGSIPSQSTTEPEQMAEEDAEMAEEVSNAEMAEEVSNAEMAEELSNAEMAEELSNAEMAEEVSGSIPSQSTTEPQQAEDSEGDHADGKEDLEVQHGEKLGPYMWPSYLDKISDPVAIGAALAAVVLAAAVSFLYMKKKQTRVVSNEPAEQVEQAEHVGQIEHVEQVEQLEQVEQAGSSLGHIAAKGSLFQSPGVEETERLGGSGPSQYSSSLSSGLGRRRNTKGEEYQVSRRDSTSQSTSSYGSFTTYQKIPAKKKKGNKEDEAMTPVRRSSRLMNVKTPEA